MDLAAHWRQLRIWRETFCALPGSPAADTRGPVASGSGVAEATSQIEAALDPAVGRNRPTG
jgi:hypothetical protein